MRLWDIIDKDKFVGVIDNLSNTEVAVMWLLGLVVICVVATALDALWRRRNN